MVNPVNQQEFLCRYTQKNNKKIGQIASGIYSPRIKKNIGLSMINRDFWDLGMKFL